MGITDSGKWLLRLHTCIDFWYNAPAYWQFRGNGPADPIGLQGAALYASARNAVKTPTRRINLRPANVEIEAGES